jgi:hypothetical protein
MADKKMWNIRVEDQLVDRCTRLGERLGYPSGNAFAAEALDQYAELLADLMAELRDDREATVKRQRERLLGKSTQDPSSSRRK